MCAEKCDGFFLPSQQKKVLSRPQDKSEGDDIKTKAWGGDDTPKWF